MGSDYALRTPAGRPGTARKPGRADAPHARRDDQRAARSAAARARELAASSEDARTPALIAALAPLPLTEREREIVTLAAAGLTNRGVSERLFLSVRTVEGHLYRAASKPGISRRSDLRRLLDR